MVEPLIVPANVPLFAVIVPFAVNVKFGLLISNTPVVDVPILTEPPDNISSFSAMIDAMSLDCKVSTPAPILRLLSLPDVPCTFKVIPSDSISIIEPLTAFPHLLSSSAGATASELRCESKHLYKLLLYHTKSPTA